MTYKQASPKYDYAVFIGRLQLPHLSHLETIKAALEQAEQVIIAIGSVNTRRTLRNPFTYEQRQMLIGVSLPSITKAILDKRLLFVPLEDAPYTDQWWVEHVQRQVKSVIRHPKEAKIALIGCNKDETTYYLDMFPQWDRIEIEQTKTFNATACRNAYFEFGIDDKSVQNELHDFTSPGVINALGYIPLQQYQLLKERYHWVENYKKEWGPGPHYTADAVVIKSGHLLLIQRGAQPDIGAWALPGGFLNEEEDEVIAAMRECQEETGLRLSQVNWRAYKTYQNPYRDERGDIRTFASLFDLGYGELPEVKGGDDASHAEWVPVSDLRAENMFGDHYHVIRDLLRSL